ncbi:hypothetical protein KM043_009148 [Ampulex compressa]|nr:hypothetical protein KM043_009148 [Ampulex compressa]
MDSPWVGSAARWSPRASWLVDLHPRAHLLILHPRGRPVRRQGHPSLSLSAASDRGLSKIAPIRIEIRRFHEDPTRGAELPMDSLLNPSRGVRIILRTSKLTYGTDLFASDSSALSSSSAPAIIQGAASAERARFARLISGAGACAPLPVDTR